MSEKDAPKEIRLVDTSPLGGAYGHQGPAEGKAHQGPLKEGHRPVAMQGPPPPPPPKTPGG